MDNAQRLKRKPQTLNKAAKPAPEKPLARPADKQAPGYLQAKMKVSQPGDAHEQQADQIAERVSRAAKPPAAAERDSLQRATLRPGQDVGDPQQSLSLKPAAEDKKPDPALRRKPAATPIATADDALDQKPAGDQPQTEQGTEQIDPSTEQRINDLRGQGQPLAESAKNDMQQELQTDLSAVRIHTGGEAADLAAAVNARAFTVGNDIFFANGEYAPDSAEGRKLLAHELTHVAQQGGGMGRLMREPAKAGQDSTSGNGRYQEGKLFVPRLVLPKKPGMEDMFPQRVNWELPKAAARTAQAQDWKKEMKAVAASWSLSSYLGNDNQLPDTAGEGGVYALKLAGKAKQNSYLLGSEGEIREQLLLPWWSSAGAPHEFHVDHILELQLGGAASDTSNFQLLDASANTSSGSLVSNAIDNAITAALPPKDVAGGETLPKNLSEKPTAAKEKPNNDPTTVPGTQQSAADKKKSNSAINKIKAGTKVVFEQVDFEGKVGGNPNVRWLFSDVEGMQHMKSLQKATKQNAPELFDNDKLRLLPKPGAGSMFVSALQGDVGSETFSGTWGDLGNITGSFNRNAGTGEVVLTLPATAKREALPGKSLKFVSGVTPTLCHIAPGAVPSAYRNAFKAKTLSPIALDNVDLDAGANFIGSGILTIDGVPLLAGTMLNVSLVNSDLVFSKTFSIDEFDVKGPIQLDSSSLTLSAGASSPLAASGTVEFHIGELAKGTLSGQASANGFTLTGALAFDQQLFAGSGSLNYDSATGFKAAGNLNLKPGALKGVKKAGFKLAYDDQKKAIDFSGDAELSVPGFKGASLSAQADEAGNISLGGEAVLSDSIPRIKAGKLNVNAARKGDAWTLGGGGELEPDLSGLDASAKIKLDYQDGVLTGKVKANYKRGMLAGNVDLNAKAQLGEGGGEAEPLRVWGSGTVDVKAAPWLKATVGLTLDEQGEITVSGELGLPSSLEVFPRKEIDKRLFGVATQIPIIPGVVAEVGGNLGAKAGIGPGALTQLKIGLTYNPDQEADTKITGSAALKVPADAGLRLAARAGIGLGITGASATGGLEIGGTLGVTGAAEAAVNIDWTPAKGLVLKADLAVHAQPSFTFDVSGYVAVTALGASLYEQRWELASYQFGSDYRFGISLPVRYTEGQAFDISLDDVKFEVPDISPSDIVHGLLSKIV